MTGPRDSRLCFECRSTVKWPQHPSRVPVRSFGLRDFLALAAGTMLLGCGSADSSIPGAWRPLQLGATTGGPACPPVSGTYGVESELLFTTLVGQHLGARAQAIDWNAFSLQGEADVGLTVVLKQAHDGTDTIHLTRGVEYRCEGGWLVPTFPVKGLPSDGNDETSRVLRRAERTVFVASAKNGALVARLRTTTHDEVPFWCGDGCTGVRVPLSARSRMRWERQLPLPANAALLDPADPRQPLEAREKRTSRRIRAALPPGVLLVGVSPNADGWQMRVDVRDKSLLMPLLATLKHTPGIADARVERAYESLNLDGSWREVLWLRFTSR